MPSSHEEGITFRLSTKASIVFFLFSSKKRHGKIEVTRGPRYDY